LYGNFEAIVTFQALIVLADEHGLIDISPQALAGRTSYPLDLVKTGLKVLQQSDPHSRSQEEDGKRIVPLDNGREFGWRIVNYDYYRNLGRRADKKASAAERQRRKRKRDSQDVDSKGCHAPVTPQSRQLAYTDTNTNTLKPLNEQAWLEYVAHRKAIKAPALSAKGVQIKQAQLRKLSPEDQQACIELSIGNGWRGLFPEKRLSRTNKGKLSYAQQLAEDLHAANR
jgi:hypothetical protein